jgi:hypothetical protein
MRPHPRTRKTAKWLLTSVALPLAAATIISFWFSFLLNYSDTADGVVGSVKISHGVLRWSRFWRSSFLTSDFDCQFTRILASDPRSQWTWRFYDLGLIGKYVFLPLWIPAVLAGFPAALLWVKDTRMRHRDRAGHCVTCGYDRKGLPDDRSCPECGSPAPRKTVPDGRIGEAGKL